MPTIRYVALTRAGETVAGTLDAATSQEALSQLRDRGLAPLELKAGWSLSLRKRVGRPQAAQVLRRLATVVARGGAPLTEILPSLVDEEEVPHVRALLAGVRDAVLRDSLPVSRAIGRYPDVFPKAATSRIAAGEAAGSLGRALEDAATFLEQSVRIRSRIIGALAYPIVIVSLALAIVTGLSVTIIPRFVAFYKQAGVPLPLISRIVVGFGTGLAHFWPVVIALLIGAGWGARRLLSRQDVRDRLDYLRWQLPGWRRVERGLAWATWAQAMAMLYTQGTQILEALQLACDAAGTAVLRDVSDLLVRRVGESGRLRQAMDEAGVFPPMLRTSVGLGEQHGTMGEMLQDAARWYGREVEVILDQLPNLLQPVAIVIVGGLVGLMVVSMYLPMFNMYGVINRLH
jgi:type IV pilus assembly protein PilC